MAVIVFFLTILTVSLPSVTQNIEKSFLQNKAKGLYELFSERSFINISLPEPISFSDQLSNQQAYFFFQRLFSSYSTFEFYPESQSFPPEAKNKYIFKARWSFKNKKNNNQYVFYLSFYLKREITSASYSLPLDLLKADRQNAKDWKIVEIKAEKI